MALKKTEFYYPRISNFKSDSSLIKIYLDSIENYGELTKIADKIACDVKEPLLRFGNEKTDFNLIIYKECSESNDIVDFSGRNVISIENETIIINDEIEKPFDSLKSVLENHILNPKKVFDYSTDIEKALIMYYQNSSYSSKDIKKQLIQIVTEFNNLNTKHSDSLPLKIKLNEYPYIRIEKPPFPTN
ncbi:MULTISPECIES: hypothetical protein [Aequorivita]|uniref:Uncharacterized protein n=2 Tax=Aequorivita TaxID=153265 RepID=A0AB35YZ07_9FLAO|nr:hypothetical protein [Aequorivita sp. Ant34-E75]WGF92345.1 hypothetical protein QCQ61_14190 [Aequorivita sp. Ant34-E75]